MAPRKSVENTAKKTPNKRVVKPKPEKPKLKNPTVIKVKIPSARLSGPNGVTPKLSRKQLTIQKKLELANEVAHAQLSKHVIISEETPPVVEVPSTTNGKRKSSVEVKDEPKKPKRNKKIFETDEVALATDEDAFETKTNQPKKNVIGKRMVNKTATENKDINKNTPDSLVTKTRSRPKLIRCRKGRNEVEKAPLPCMEESIDIGNIEVKPEPDISTETDSYLENTDLKDLKTNPVVEIAERNIVRSKCNGMMTRSSKRKLERKEVPKDVCSTMEKGEECAGGARPVERKASENSNSAMSWTHDISTSSTTTCVTVTSHDFVRFDRKLPVVQVVNMHDRSPSSSESSSSSSSSSDSSGSTSEPPSSARRELDLSASSFSGAASPTRSPRHPPAAPASHLASAPRVTPASATCVTPASIHRITPPSAPRVTPPSAPRVTPPSAPRATPPSAPCVIPATAPRVTPTFAPRVTPPSAPCVTPATVPRVTPPSAPRVTPPSAPRVTPASEPRITLPSAPRVTLASPPRFISDSAPRLTPASAPRVTPVSATRVTPAFASPAPRVPFLLDEMAALLDRCADSLRNFDDEAADWANPTAPAVPTALAALRIRESDTLVQCRRLRRLLAAPVDFARPAPPRPRAPPAASPPPAPPCDDFTSDRVRYVPFDHNADDDYADAVSLFAESIVSSRYSASLAAARLSPPAAPAAPPISPALDEYVPSPVAPRAFESRRYRPTPITATAPPPPSSPPPPAVCEKQSADSTSVRAPPPPPLLADVSVSDVTPVKDVHSALFRGLCFFNLVGACRYAACRFPHAQLDARAARLRLAPLSDAALLREYALAREHAALRRRVAPAVAAECARRGLSRALLEAAADAVGGPGADAALEAALHLGAAGLRAAAAAGLLGLRAGAAELADALLAALADTPNFSRFRAAFAELAAHAAARGRAVPLPVASKILERACILPCDAALARAMLALMSCTDPLIYHSPMIATFEKRLAAVGGGVLDEFLRAKERAIRAPAAPAPPVPSVRPGPPSEPAAGVDPAAPGPAARCGSDREKRYTSPDTTHFDNMNNLSIEPMITRKVEFTRALSNTTLMAYNPSVPRPAHPAHKFNVWQKGNFQTHQRLASGRLVRTPNGVNMRMMRAPPPHTRGALNKTNRRTITRRPTNYQRRSGGDFYD